MCCSFAGGPQGGGGVGGVVMFCGVGGYWGGMQNSHLRMGLPDAHSGAAGKAAHMSSTGVSVRYLDVNQYPLERPAVQSPRPCLADQLTELHSLNGECILAALHKALRGRQQLSRYPACASCICRMLPACALPVAACCTLGREQPCLVGQDDMPVHDCASAHWDALNSSTQLGISKSGQTKRWCRTAHRP